MDSKTETLLRVWEALREQSLAHRTSIREACGWWIAGTLVLAAGVLALTDRSFMSASLVTFIVLVADVSFLLHVRYQRKQSEEQMRKIREIETTLKFYEPGEYLAQSTALPPKWKDAPRMRNGLTKGDEITVSVPLILSCAVITLAWWLMF